MNEKEVNMPTIRFTVNNENYEDLEKRAQKANLSMQDYIRKVLFEIDTIFTPEEAIKRVKNGAVDGLSEFTLPDIYGDEWTIERGPAGVFGKAFYNYIQENIDLGIVFVNMGKYGRRATYKMVDKK